MTIFLRVLAYPAAVVIFVAIGQVLSWVVGALAAFANITGMIATVLGEEVAFGVAFVAGSLAYAAAAGYGVVVGLTYLMGKRNEGDAEVLGGVLAGVFAFLIVTIAAEPFVYFLINALPDVADAMATSEGIGAFVTAVLVHSAAVGAAGLLLYLPAKAFTYRAVEHESTGA